MLTTLEFKNLRKIYIKIQIGYILKYTIKNNFLLWRMNYDNMQQPRSISRALWLLTKANFKRFHMYDHLFYILDMNKLQRQRTGQWLPGCRDWKMSVILSGYCKGIPLCLVRGGYTSTGSYLLRSKNAQNYMCVRTHTISV